MYMIIQCDIKNIILLGLCVIVIYYFLNKNKEKMTNTSDITTAVKNEINKIYKADIESIRNLSLISQKLQKDGLTVAGDLTVDGNITVKKKSVLKGDLTNNSINNKINNINNNLNSKINNINNNLNSKISNLENKVNSKIKAIINKNKNDYIYGVNKHNNIYSCKKPCNGGWTRIPGGLVSISQDSHNDGYVYGTNKHNNFYKCKKPCTGSWVPIGGKLKQVSA